MTASLEQAQAGIGDLSLSASAKAPQAAAPSASSSVSATPTVAARPKPCITFLDRSAPQPLRTAPASDSRGRASYYDAWDGAEPSGSNDSGIASTSGAQGAEVPAASPDIAAPDEWIPLAECHAHFPLKAWWSVMLELVRHPERNSTYILRADVLSEVEERSSGLGNSVELHDDDDEEGAAEQEDTHSSPSRQSGAYMLRKTVKLRLLPRKPAVDKELLQECRFYRRTRKRRRRAGGRSSLDEDVSTNPPASPEDALVIFTPIPADPATEDQEAEIPWYHPKVKHIAFRYLTCEASANGADGEAAPAQGRLRIDVQLFAPTAALLQSPPSASLPVSHRLMRTAQALLEVQHKHSFGHANAYAKRVTHDLVVGRERFQDTYMALKGKYAEELMRGWAEKTDPSKHVFEDLGIAAFLIELWRDTYPLSAGQPPGGFVDVGCGNGLLVHILRRERYRGFGIDLRARKSWPAYETRASQGAEADLRVVSLDAPLSVIDASAPGALRLPEDSFLIGNHADELTPWIPLLAAQTPGEHVGFINIPCCPWLLNGEHFTRIKYVVEQADVREALRLAATEEPSSELVEQQLHNIHLGAQTAGSAAAAAKGASSASPRGPAASLRQAQSSTRNVAYLRYVSLLQLQAGWLVEKEALRIPSTKNWCLIGRRRVWQPPHSSSAESSGQGQPADLGAEGSQAVAVGVAARAAVAERVSQMARAAAPGWKARIPEGNAGKGHA